jgi:hypothetical protein
MVGLKSAMVGAPVGATVKTSALVAEPEATVTPIAPVVAPAGTVVTTFVALAEVTVAATPLNVTAFSVGVALNPVPEIVTFVPTGPSLGEKSIIETTDVAWREIERRVPTAS